MANTVSDEDLLNDLEKVATKLNESPTIDQYKTHGKYPPWKIRYQFGSWSKAKQEAGLDLNRTGSTHHTSKKALINDVQRVAENLGRSPTATQYNDEGKYSLGTLQRHFGSWNEAKKRAGIETYTEKGNPEYTNEELLNDLREFANERDGALTFQEYRKREGPDPSVLESRFGSWNKAKERVGLEPNPQHRSKSYDHKEELLDDLKRVATEIGESPSQRQYRAHGEFTPSTLQDSFNSWNNAKREAGLPVHQPDEFVPSEELIRDLQRTANLLGTTPSKKQYDEWGEYSHTLCQKRLDSWNLAVAAAGLNPNIEFNISEEELLDDIKEVASTVDVTPTVDDYREHGRYGLGPIYDNFDSWMTALNAAGYEWSKYDYSDEELLRSLRDISDGEYAPRRSVYEEDWAHSNIKRRFGSWWGGCVQAGLLPRSRRPLTPRAIHEYHRAAVSLEPHYRTYALLFQFTGMPARIVECFTADWVADRRKRNIIRVPSEITQTGEPWLFQYPDQWYNPYTGESEATELPETLNWFTNIYDEVPLNKQVFSQIIKRVSRQGDLEDFRQTIYHTNIGYVPDVNPVDLRMTQGVNLVEQEADEETIRRHLGTEESKWGGSVKDCYLWAYIHRDYEPQNYDPPDIVLGSVK